jgi:hypothetical protein
MTHLLKLASFLASLDRPAHFCKAIPAPKFATGILENELLKINHLRHQGFLLRLAADLHP